MGKGGEVRGHQSGLSRGGQSMRLHRRRFLHLVAGAAMLPAVSRVARAQAYPTRPVHLILPFGPAGATDITARLIGQWLSERLGQQFVIENRPGAGGNIATEAVVRAAPDGYTLLYVTTANASNATLYDKLNFNFVRDIAPIAPIVGFPYIMVVNPSVSAKTLPEFIAYAKTNPGKINMASPGIGSTPHVNGELFKMMTGTNLVHVPYRGMCPVQTSPDKSSDVGQTLVTADNLSILVQNRPDGFNPVHETLPRHRG